MRAALALNGLTGLLFKFSILCCRLRVYTSDAHQEPIRISAMERICENSLLTIFAKKVLLQMFDWVLNMSLSLREKCPNTELFLVRILLYSARIQENTD